MSSDQKIGEISKIETSDHKWEWEIDDFFSYTKENFQYVSPVFYLLNSTWQLKIYPNGKDTTSSVGHISLYLHRIDKGSSMSVDFTLGLKTKEKLFKELKTSWKEDVEGWGWHKFIKRSKVNREMENSVPSGKIVVTCSLFVKDRKEFYADESRKNLAAALKDMFVLKKNTDVTIKVKEETFTAHRFVLSARSPVLLAMFENDTIEKKNGLIIIPDCDPKSFGHFLLYLYSGELDYSEKCDFFHLYTIADKYVVEELKMLCIDVIIREISVKNLCDTYVFGDQFNASKLLTAVQDFFTKNYNEIVSSDSFLTFMKEYPDLAQNLLKGGCSSSKKRKVC